MEKGNLILQRKPGEKVFIEGGIEIVVVEVTRGRCRLMIRAPLGLLILRGELAESHPKFASDREI